MKTIPLIVLGAVSLVLSRAAFFLINDPEGPNLLIVVVLAAVMYAVLLGAYYLYTLIKRGRVQ